MFKETYLFSERQVFIAKWNLLAGAQLNLISLKQEYNKKMQYEHT